MQKVALQMVDGKISPNIFAELWWIRKGRSSCWTSFGYIIPAF